MDQEQRHLTLKECKDNRTLVEAFNVPTNFVLVGASNVPSVDLANAEVVAD